MPGSPAGLPICAVLLSSPEELALLGWLIVLPALLSIAVPHGAGERRSSGTLTFPESARDDREPWTLFRSAADAEGAGDRCRRGIFRPLPLDSAGLAVQETVSAVRSPAECHIACGTVRIAGQERLR